MPPLHEYGTRIPALSAASTTRPPSGTRKVCRTPSTTATTSAPADGRDLHRLGIGCAALHGLRPRAEILEVDFLARDASVQQHLACVLDQVAGPAQVDVIDVGCRADQRQQRLDLVAVDAARQERQVGLGIAAQHVQRRTRRPK